MHVVRQNYPSLGDILDFYSDVIRTLEITKSETSNSVKLVAKQKTLSLSKSKSTKVSWKPSTLDNFFMKPTLASHKYNFCRCNSHSAFYCKKYPARRDCLQQCWAAKLCIYCSSPALYIEQCPGKNGRLYPYWKCKSCEHVSALYPILEKSQMDINPCLQIRDMNLLLLIVQNTIFRDKLKKTFNCPLDSGSQCSYLSDGVLDILHCRSVPMKKRSL